MAGRRPRDRRSPDTFHLRQCGPPRRYTLSSHATELMPGQKTRTPEQVGEAVGRHQMPSCREEDLEHLLATDAAEVAPRSRVIRRRPRAVRKGGWSGGGHWALLRERAHTPPKTELE